MDSISFQSTYGSALNLPAKALANGSDTLRRHTLNGVLGIGDNKGHVLAVGQGANETAGAELVHLGVGGAVEVEGDAVALGSGAVAPAQHGGIVAAHLGAAGAVGGGAVKLVEDQAVDGVGAVVDAGGQDVDAEHVLLGRAQTELSAGAVDLGADVHGGARLVGRDVLGIEGDGSLYGVEEQVSRDGRAADEGGRVLHADGVAVGAEDLNVAGGGAECLETLIGLLAVVQGRGHAVDADEGVRDELGSSPFPRLDRVVALDVAIDWSAQTGSQ